MTIDCDTCFDLYCNRTQLQISHVLWVVRYVEKYLLIEECDPIEVGISGDMIYTALHNEFFEALRSFVFVSHLLQPFYFLFSLRGIFNQNFCSLYAFKFLLVPCSVQLKFCIPYY